MITKIYGEDISASEADAVINASNGVGYMGGWLCIKTRQRGVAESLQYASKGKVEKLSRKEAKDRGIFGFPPGSVFVTEAPGLHTQHVIHAVTMRFPGSRSKKSVIRELIPEIVRICEELHVKSVAIPLLGTGTGGLKKSEILRMYEEAFENSQIEWRVYLWDEKNTD